MFILYFFKCKLLGAMETRLGCRSSVRVHHAQGQSTPNVALATGSSEPALLGVMCRVGGVGVGCSVLPTASTAFV